MYNSILDPSELNDLSDICIRKKTELVCYDVSKLASLILYEFPSLAKNFLGIDNISGQFLNYKDFITRNNNIRFSTPLDIELVGRENELCQLSQKLETNNFLVLLGEKGGNDDGKNERWKR